MSYLTIIIIAVAGITLGYWLARRSRASVSKESSIPEQSRKKQENKQKILDFLRANNKVANNDVENLLGVSDATAERYLNELEHEGKLTQHGVIGKGVFYTSSH